MFKCEKKTGFFCFCLPFFLRIDQCLQAGLQNGKLYCSARMTCEICTGKQSQIYICVFIVSAVKILFDFIFCIHKTTVSCYCSRAQDNYNDQMFVKLVGPLYRDMFF